MHEAVARFEEAWRRGEEPVIDDYLPSDKEQSEATLVRLVGADLAHRLEAGEEVRVERYLEQYTVLAEDRASALQLIAAEYKLRDQTEPEVPTDEYLSRFPDYQDELRGILSADSDAEAADVTTAWQPDGDDDEDDEDTSFALEFDEESLPMEFGRYELLSVVGQGGFGTVYEAHDSQLDREVAVKIPRAGTLGSESQVQRLYREARSGARLRHPGICPIYDVGEHRGHHYIVMGLIEGNPLTRYKKPMDSKKAAVIILKLADALVEAHDQGIIHRDLKPSNIIIEKKRREPVILDFGLARQVVSDVNLTQEGQVFGTPTYMSPEQARAGRVKIGHSTDIYSLGVILYELVAGRPPFQGSMAEVFAQILTSEPKPPSKYHAELDSTIESITLKAIAKDPSDRFESMQEFGKALKGYVTGAGDKSTAEPGSIAAPEPIQEKLEQHTDTPYAAGISAETTKIEFACPECQLPVRTPSSAAGKKGMCPNCGAVVAIPKQSTRGSSKEAPRERRGLVAQLMKKTADSSVSIEFPCPHCQRLVRTPPGTAGKKGKCPGCGRIVTIPMVKSV